MSNKHIKIMKLKTLSLWVLVSLSILLSGCVNRGASSASNAGLVIDVFDISPQEIYEGEDVFIDLVVRNAGNKNMPDDSRLWIYGINFKRTWQPSGDIVYATNRDGLDIPTKDLMPGEQISLSGSLTYIADISQGVTKEYEIYARLCYPYITTYATNLWVVNRDEARLEKKKGIEYDKLSSGPISIAFTLKDRTVTGRAVSGTINIGGSTEIGSTTININVNYETNEEGNTVRTLYLPFEIINRGGGIPFVPNRCQNGPNLKFEESNKVALHIELDGQDITSMCTTPENLKTITLNIGGNSRTADIAIVNLRNNKGRITCKIRDLDFDVPQKSYDIEVTAFYDYYITQSRKVIVKSEEDIY